MTRIGRVIHRVTDSPFRNQEELDNVCGFKCVCIYVCVCASHRHIYDAGLISDEEFSSTASLVKHYWLQLMIVSAHPGCI